MIAAAPTAESAVRPLLKWAGGKRRLVPELLARMPTSYERYVEPFVGGGALFFAMAPRAAVISDANEDLIAFYRAVASWPDDVWRAAARLASRHRSDGSSYLRERRSWNRPRAKWAPDRAAQMLYLNRACFNGLWRVNASGELNTPPGRLHLSLPTLEDLRGAAALLTAAAIRCGDFADACSDVGPGDIVYADPPYDPTSTTSSFTAYAAGGFGADDQRRLRDEAERWYMRGATVIVSSSDTPQIRQLWTGAWQGWRIDEVSAPRSVSARAQSRGVVTELIIRSPQRSPRSRRGFPLQPVSSETTSITKISTTREHEESKIMNANITIEDVVERGLRRMLPVKLTEREFTEIAKRRVVAENERDKMEADRSAEDKRRKVVIAERDADILRMRNELHSGTQERSVPCTKVFRRDLKGECWVVTVRDDTGAEVAKEPAPQAMINRHLQTSIPGTADAPLRSVLDEARDKQAAEDGAAALPAGAAAAVESDVPRVDDDADDDANGVEQPECVTCGETIGEDDPTVTDSQGDVVHAHCADFDDDDDDEDDEDDEESAVVGNDTPPKRAAVPRSSKTAKIDGGNLVFSAGDLVTWKSQAGGAWKTKTGEVHVVVPADQTPRSIDQRFQWSSARKHTSYVVDVDGELYWPVVSQLRLAKAQKGGK